MGIQYDDQTIQRYNQLFEDYLAMSKKVESCFNEEREFYQYICYLFAKKMKKVRQEMSEQGFVIR